MAFNSDSECTWITSSSWGWGRLSCSVFAITYEYTKLKKGHTNNDNEGLIIVAEFGTILLLFLATQEYTISTQGAHEGSKVRRVWISGLLSCLHPV
jgi:hypothetical protein